MRLTVRNCSHNQRWRQRAIAWGSKSRVRPRSKARVGKLWDKLTKSRRTGSLTHQQVRFPGDIFTKIQQNLHFYRHLPGRVTNPWDHTDPVYPSNSSVKGHLRGLIAPISINPGLLQDVFTGTLWSTRILSQTENFQETLLISRMENYSSRFPWFPGVLDTLQKVKQLADIVDSFLTPETIKVWTFLPVQLPILDHLGAKRHFWGHSPPCLAHAWRRQESQYTLQWYEIIIQQNLSVIIGPLGIVCRWHPKYIYNTYSQQYFSVD